MFTLDEWNGELFYHACFGKFFCGRISHCTVLTVTHVYYIWGYLQRNLYYNKTCHPLLCRPLYISRYNCLPKCNIAFPFCTCSAAKVSVCLLSNTCMGMGVIVISRLEIRQEGLTWENAGEDLSLDDDFHMGWVYGMLIFDAIWYYLLAWWVHIC